MKIFDRLHKEGKTVILITHDEDIAKHAERLIRVKDGKVVSDTHT
jgi:putative ABC transport system ATP-binding protein